MGEYRRCRIILSLLMGLILLAFCLPICAFASPSGLSDGDEEGILLSTTVPPSIISGADSVYKKGSGKSLTFETDDAKDNLLRVLIDGEVIPLENYTISGEPLTITLNTGYLETLSTGEHTIEIVTTNGTARTEFTIKSSGGTSGTDTPTVIPSTGEEISYTTQLGALMMIAGVSCLAGLALSKRKKKKQL